jgi:hypothetical protein
MTQQCVRLSIAIFVTLLAAPASVFAQDTASSGLVISTPGSVIGAIWRVSDSVAIRPEISVSISKSDNGNGTERTNRSLIPGVSVLMDAKRWDAVRTYVAARYTYERETSDVTTPVGTNEGSQSFHGITGSIGAELTAHRRFGVFGEVGLGYSRLSDDAPGSAQSFGTRTNVGVILYF